MNCKVYGRKWSWPIEVLYASSYLKVRKTTKKLVRMAGVPLRRHLTQIDSATTVLTFLRRIKPSGLVQAQHR
jgi:hypothetical protein